MKKTPTKRTAKKEPKKPTTKRDSLDDDLTEDPKPRPAFRPFELENEWDGKNLMRSLVNSLHGGKYNANIGTGLSALLQDALGKPYKWQGYFNDEQEFVFREEHKPIPPLEAAEDLVRLALDAIKYVDILYRREPGLCREVARRLAEWPVSTDLTAKDWKRDAQKLIDDLSLGSGIAGYLKSARTSDENPIRLYATAIYETLFQTRFTFKRADSTRYQTREGCPPWAEKTLSLPIFIKSNVAEWMKVGKEMLLEQRPDFLEDEAFRSQKFKWSRRAAKRSKSGKTTIRAIQNEAFTDIAKEMKSLAPTEPLYRGKW